MVEFDTETTGLDWYSEDLICYQFGVGSHQIVVDHSSYPIELFKDLLEEKTLLGQNLLFDLCFLYKHNIWPKKVRDTLLAEKVLTTGLTVRRSMKALLKRYLGLERDKTMQSEIHKVGLTKEGIEYAGLDVRDLTEIFSLQTTKILEQDMGLCAKLEFDFTRALAYVEYCGIHLHWPEWEEICRENDEKLAEAQDRLDQFVRDNMPEYVDRQLDLFSKEQKALVNWSSPDQVVPIMEKLGLNVVIFEGGKEKKSINKNVIAAQRDKTPLVDLYMDYRFWMKRASTYGRSWKDHIRDDGRIHTKFQQILNTGRISSGEKSRRERGRDYPNIQNLPREDKYRHAFQAQGDNVMVVADYSSQESVILADRSKEPKLLEFYQSGAADLHSFVAKLIYNLDCEISEVKKKHPSERQNAKSANFAIAYGGDGYTIAKNLGISVEEGQRVYDGYLAAFPDLAKYFDKQERKILDKGYIIIDPITNRRSYFKFYDKWKELDEKIDSEYWQRYRMYKKLGGPEFDPLKKEVQWYFRTKSEMRKMALNYPIQGCLPHDTCVLTKKGWLPIGNFVDGMEVWTGENWAPATRVERGYAQRVNLHLNDGRTIAFDDRHKLLISPKDSAWPKWCDINEIEGEELVRPHDPDFGVAYLDPEDWYWAGRILGDGYVRGNGYWGCVFRCTDDNYGEHEAIESFKLWLRKWNFKGRTNSTKGWTEGYSCRKRKTCFQFNIAAKDTHRVWKMLGFTPGLTSRYKKVPDIVFTLDRIRREQFLKGWYEADGRTYDGGNKKNFAKVDGLKLDRLTTASCAAASGAVQLAASLGIRAKSFTVFQKEKDKESNFYHNVYFYLTDEPLIAECVEYTGVYEPMYTLTVDDPKHAFSSEGVISKNTAGSMTKKAASDFFDWVIQKDLQNRVRICNLVHDEIITECPRDLAQEVSDKLKECMEEAGNLFLDILTIKAEPVITDHWTH
jgi:DNA polymerase-1